MITKVTGEQPFQVLATNFSISPSQQGYTLQISADGVNYSNLFAVSPNVTRMVSGVANGSYYRLSGNTSEVVINWSRQCSTGGGDVDLTNYWTSAQTQDAIDEAVSGITVDLTDYYTSAQTNTQIQNAVADFVTSGQVETQITSKGYATESAVTSAITAIENELGDFVTSADVETQIISKGYATESAVTSAITALENELSDYVTSGDIQTINERINTKDEVISIALNELHEQIENIDIPDVSNFVTSGDVQTQITSAVTAIENELSEAEQVTSTALVDINSRMVSSELIKTIVKMSQAEYDALATKDNNTLYIIG